MDKACFCVALSLGTPVYVTGIIVARLVNNNSGEPGNHLHLAACNSHSIFRGDLYYLYLPVYNRHSIMRREPDMSACPKL
jgi:hypothetical protein